MRRVLLSGSFYVCLFSGAVALGGGCATAQGHPGEAPKPSGTLTATTVSVASLGVSAGAREHYRLALVAYKARRNQECDSEIAKALEMSPDFPEGHLFRATLEVNRHAYDDAIGDVLAAQRLDAGLVWAPVALAEAYNGLHRYQDALLILQNMHGSVITSWQVKYEMARAEVGLKRAEESIYWSSAALAALPQSFPEAHLLYANALELSERWSDAGQELRLYLASPGLLIHRVEATSALAILDSRAQESKVQEQSSRAIAVR